VRGRADGVLAAMRQARCSFYHHALFFFPYDGERAFLPSVKYARIVMLRC